VVFEEDFCIEIPSNTTMVAYMDQEKVVFKSTAIQEPT